MCLHCRQEERIASASRRRHATRRLGAAVGALALIGFVGAQGVRAFYLRLPSAGRRSASTRVVAHRPQLVSESSTPIPAVLLSPAIPQGRMALPGGEVAIRAGDSVTVEFDTPLARTRRADKFEVTVRATLPQIFGAVADTLLSTIPAGRLISDRELLSESPFGGLRLDGGARGAIAIWPVTRRGQSGPLVIAYRAVAAR